MFDSVWIRKRKKLPGVIERLLVLAERVENRFCFYQTGARAQSTFGNGERSTI